MMSSAANQSFCWRLVIRLNNCLLPTMCQACTENCPKIDEWNKPLWRAHSDFLLLFSCQVRSDSLRLTPWTIARQASLSFTISWSLLKLISIQSVMPPNHLILCHPLLLLPLIFPSIRVFSKESALHIRWPKYWSFISPSSEYSGLLSVRID